MTPDFATIPDPDELPIGTRLVGGRYTIKARIGRGGAATVYIATTTAGHEVALKVLGTEAAKDSVARERFQNEATFAQYMVEHPRVVTPYEVGTVPELDGRPYMTMPFIQGRPLYRMTGRLGQTEALTLMRDLALVVAEVHDRGIVHRDIKPANVLVSNVGGKVPYLIDFGVAWTRHSSAVPVRGNLTTAHELPGTKHYMAPEQVLGARPTPAFDVYALAITTLEVLSGELPLTNLTGQEVVQRKCDRNQPSLRAQTFAVGLPEEVRRVIDSALQRDPAQRTPDARRFAEHLTGVLARLGGAAAETPPALVATPVPPRSSSTPPTARSMRAVVGLVAVLLVLGGVGLWVLWSGPSEHSRVAEAAEHSPAAGIAASTVAMVEPPGGSTTEAPPAPTAAPQPIPDVPAEPIPDVPAEAVAAPPKPAPRKPTPPKPAPKVCDDVAAAAAAAAKAKNWTKVVSLTRSKRCWDNDQQRAELRVSALMMLGRYAECVKVGRRSNAPQVARIVNACQSRLDEGNN